ncbi:hypothetical protein BX600DRAFT_404403 [Xylariales sp. PMI_506]|nr:hypothetical protein BX600DRAFT_404403 [Xylariales sp. PMI_506]
MAPVRVGIIGLSPTAGASWASRAHLPYLLSPAGRSKFQIVALCNSSVEAARRAIEHFKLAPEIRAYGDPADMAADAEVDLVVNTTRADKHFDTILPSVERGKDVFVEWPLTEAATKAEKLVTQASKSGSKTLVGLQGRFAPSVRKLKEVINSGRIGKVLSSDVRAFGGTPDRAAFPTHLRVFTDKQVGANTVTVTFGHLADSVQFVLGDIRNPTYNAQTQRPEVEIVEVPSGQVTEIKRVDVPDLVFMTGSLKASKSVVPDATLHLQYRRGQPFKGEPALVWTINGEKGEIRLTSPGSIGPAFQTGLGSETIEVHNFATDEVEQVGWDWSSAWAELPHTARNIGAIYEAYAAADSSDYATFNDALRRQKALDPLLH